jgi:acyl carrier protein
MSDGESRLEEARRLLARGLGIATSQVVPGAALSTLAAWDSIGHVSVIASIEKRLGRRLDPQELVAIRDVHDIARLLDSALPLATIRLKLEPPRSPRCVATCAARMPWTCSARALPACGPRAWPPGMS